MAIEHNNSNAMHNLAVYYQTQDEINLMIKYYLMAVDHGNTDSMAQLGYFYETQSNTELMIKYYELYINNVHIGSILLKRPISILLNNYITRKEYEKIRKLLFVVIRLENKELIDLIKNEYFELFTTSYDFLYNKYNDQIFIIEDLKYRPDGPEYLNIKKSFDDKKDKLNNVNYT